MMRLGLGRPQGMRAQWVNVMESAGEPRLCCRKPDSLLKLSLSDPAVKWGDVQVAFMREHASLAHALPIPPGSKVLWQPQAEGHPL